VKSEKPHVKAVILGFQLACLKIEQQSLGGNGSNGGVHYTNKAGSPSDIEVDATVTGIKYTIEGVCHEGSEPTTFSNGTYSGEVTVQPENAPGDFTSASFKE
jgi:hypothetical protein